MTLQYLPWLWGHNFKMNSQRRYFKMLCKVAFSWLWVALGGSGVFWMALGDSAA